MIIKHYDLKKNIKGNINYYLLYGANSGLIEETINYLEKNNLGKRKTNFRLKDWGISRQRYWGCPIPIAYDENNNPFKIPENMLPVKLPEIEKFTTEGNPLEEIEEWKNIKINGKKYRRETDTLDTFVDSSWYFLRFCSSKNTDYGFNKKDYINLITSNNIRGLDRVVPFGQSMNFTMNWDSYNLITSLSRVIEIDDQI